MQAYDSGNANTPARAAAEPANVSQILKRLGVLAPDASDISAARELVSDAFLAALQESAACQDVVTQLFPNGVPTDRTFFERLGEVRRYFAYTRSGEEAIGLVWSEAMRRLTAAGQQSLLWTYVRRKPHQVFENLSSLWVVIRDRQFSPAFLAEWFVELVRPVERDHMQEGAWKAIRTLCAAHVGTALEVLQLLRGSSPDGTRLNIAGFMLGVMRTLDLTGEHESTFRQLETSFQGSSDARVRAVFDWSWTATARERRLTPEELASLFRRASQSDEDHNTVIRVACQLLIATRDLDDGTAQHCRVWIGDQASAPISEDAKLLIAHAAQMTTLLTRGSDDVAPSFSGWILSIQPVAVESVGTWRAIAGYLCELLQRDREQFKVIFERLAFTGAGAIHRLMHDGHLSRLLTDMGNAGLDDLVGRLCVSSDMHMRRLGLYLFDSLEVPVFPQAPLASSSIACRLLFYESQRVILSPKSIARILVAVAPFAEGTSDGFREEVLEELQLQAHNFAGECRTELAIRGAPITLVARALADVATYFADLDRAHKAGINAMEVPGYRRAVREHQRRLSRQVRTGERSHSPLLGLLKTTKLLYGRAVSTYFGGRLSDANPLATFSASMELPFVYYSDPEEMAIRRLHASMCIDDLLETQDPASSVSEPGRE
jgi:hypothetical protein